MPSIFKTSAKAKIWGGRGFAEVVAFKQSPKTCNDPNRDGAVVKSISVYHYFDERDLPRMAPVAERSGDSLTSESLLRLLTEAFSEMLTSKEMEMLASEIRDTLEISA